MIHCFGLRTSAVLWIALAVGVPSVEAQGSFELEIEPSSPGSLDEVFLRVRAACPVAYEAPVVDDGVITLIAFEPTPPPLAPCTTELGYEYSALIGTLAGGVYEAKLYYREADGSLTEVASSTFIVTSEASPIRYQVNSGSLIKGLEEP